MIDNATPSTQLIPNLLTAGVPIGPWRHAWAEPDAYAPADRPVTLLHLTRAHTRPDLERAHVPDLVTRTAVEPCSACLTGPDGLSAEDDLWAQGMFAHHQALTWEHRLGRLADQKGHLQSGRASEAGLHRAPGGGYQWSSWLHTATSAWTYFATCPQVTTGMAASAFEEEFATVLSHATGQHSSDLGRFAAALAVRVHRIRRRIRSLDICAEAATGLAWANPDGPTTWVAFEHLGLLLTGITPPDADARAFLLTCPTELTVGSWSLAQMPHTGRLHDDPSRLVCLGATDQLGTFATLDDQARRHVEIAFTLWVSDRDRGAHGFGELLAAVAHAHAA